MYESYIVGKRWVGIYIINIKLRSIFSSLYNNRNSGYEIHSSILSSWISIWRSSLFAEYSHAEKSVWRWCIIFKE